MAPVSIFEEEENLHLFIFIKCIGVIFLNKILQVSGIWLHSTSSVYHIMCSPQVKSPSITISPRTLSYLPPTHLFPSGDTVVCAYEFCFFPKSIPFLNSYGWTNNKIDTKPD